MDRGVLAVAGATLAFFGAFLLVDSLLPDRIEERIRRFWRSASFIALMLAGLTWHVSVAPGVILDARGAVVAAAIAFEGPLVGAAVALAGALYRALIGGAGAWAGIAGFALDFALASAVWLVARKAGAGRKPTAALSAALGVAVGTGEALSLLLIPPPAAGLDLFVRTGGTLFSVQLLCTLIIGTLGRLLWERRQESSELKAEQVRTRAALETSMDGFALVTAEGRLVEVNEALCSLSRCSRDELLARSLVDFAVPPAGMTVAARIQEILDTGSSRWEAGWRGLDGTVLDVEVSVSLVRTEGRPYFASFIRDVSGRRKVETDLLHERDRLATATASGRVRIWEWDIPADRVRVSGYIDPRMAAAIAGVVEGTVAYEDLVHPDDRERFRAAMKAHLESGAPYALEYRVRGDGGSWLHWRDIAACARDAGGRPVRMSGACIDITELKLAQAALEASRERLEEAQALAGLGSWELDLATGKLDWSREVYRLFEIDPASFGSSYDSFLAQIHPDDRPLVDAAYRRSVEERSLYELDHRLLMPDGRVKWVRERGRTEFGPDGPLRTAGTIQDVTDHILAREARNLAAAKEAAEAANKAKSAFLASMSHEIRTPMNAILGFSQLLLGDEGLSPRQKDQLHAISRSGEHLLTLINDILEMSKIEAGRVTLNPEEVDLFDLLWDLETLFRPKTLEKGLTFHVERAPDLPRHVQTDAVKLRQILINLVGNAVKFTAEGGVSVRIDCEGAAPGSLRLRAAVEDTGPGIPPDDIPKLFQRFEQTRTGREARTGTGLGLAISQGFARLMGGDISVASRVGSGSVFRVELVAERSAREPEAPPAQPDRRIQRLSPDASRRRILVADDVAENREVLVGMLSRVGFEVATAADGIEALAAFASFHPDLVLMDLRMPALGGLDAIRSIRGIPGGAAVPIVAVTASTFEEDRRMVEEAGGDGFVAKPFREADLVRTVGDLLEIGYVFEEKAPAAASTALFVAVPSFRVPPEPFRGALLAATARGDLDRILRIADELDEVDLEAARAIRDLAEQFDYDRLRSLIEAGGVVG